MTVPPVQRQLTAVSRLSPQRGSLRLGVRILAAAAGGGAAAAGAAATRQQRTPRQVDHGRPERGVAEALVHHCARLAPDLLTGGAPEAAVEGHA